MSPWINASSAGTFHRLTVRLLVICGVIALSYPLPSPGETSGWEQLEPGLELGRFNPQSRPEATINVLRIDPTHFEFNLFNASAENKTPLTPKQWAYKKGLVAVINASMFQEDLLTSVSLMRTKNHVNNNYVSKDKTILAFDPVKPDIPPVKIIDRQCEDFETGRANYSTLIQSIRMISCDGRNVWRSHTDEWSVASIGIDKSGKILFIHTESTFVTHDLINTLMKLPLDITQAMYVEGGPQAQLYVNSGGQTLEFVGQMSGLFQQGGRLAWPVPNVVGLTRKSLKIKD